MSGLDLPPRGLPFGLDGVQPVFDRATDMAAVMFDGYASALAIVHQGRMWRTRDPEGKLPKTSVLAEHVLAAEDNSVNQLVLKTLLHQVGVDPVVVSDGEQALEAWRREPWDLILMDVQMPVLDGPDATRRIRSEEVAAGRRRTPIVALTANAMAHQISDYLASGMDGFVAKPIDAAKLFAAIAEAVSTAEASRAA